MKELHCPTCGTSFVRATAREGRVERVLGCVNIFPFRCQLCTKRFRALWSSGGENTLAFDRRQYKRLPTSIEAQILTDSNLRSTNRITDISMGGCTLQTTAELARGTFLELVLKPAAQEEPIRVDTAMICSVRPSSLGIRFLELELLHKQRLSQVVLGLLVGHSQLPATNA